MTITATRFATHIRTWLLIAALTGLLIAISAAIGGAALFMTHPPIAERIRRLRALDRSPDLALAA